MWGFVLAFFSGFGWIGVLLIWFTRFRDLDFGVCALRLRVRLGGWGCLLGCLWFVGFWVLVTILLTF